MKGVLLIKYRYLYVVLSAGIVFVNKKKQSGCIEIQDIWVWLQWDVLQYKTEKTQTGLFMDGREGRFYSPVRILSMVLFKLSIHGFISTSNVLRID